MPDPSVARAAGNGGLSPKGAVREPEAGSRTVGLALAALTVCVWGVTFVSTKALLADFSALEILVLRFAVAWTALWAIHPRGLGRLQRREELLFAAGASRLLLGERTLTRRFLAGCALALAGIALVALDGIRGLRFRPAGDALALGSAMSWGVYSALITVVNRSGRHPVAAIRRTFFWALVFMVPLVASALLAPEAAAHVSCSFNLSPGAAAARLAKALNLGNLAFLGLLASAVCFVSWNAACDRLGTVRCSLGLYLVPVIAFLAAHVFLGETIPAAGVAGALLVLAGVAVAGRR